jgi:hypothetical protein
MCLTANSATLCAGSMFQVLVAAACFGAVIVVISSFLSAGLWVRLLSAAYPS